MSGLFERLGIAADVRAKAVLVPGGLVAYAAGVSAKSRFGPAARVLLQVLMAPEAVEVIRAKGMTPAP